MEKEIREFKLRLEKEYRVSALMTNKSRFLVSIFDDGHPDDKLRSQLAINKGLPPLPKYETTRDLGGILNNPMTVDEIISMVYHEFGIK